MDYLKKASLHALVVSFTIFYVGCSSFNGPLFKAIKDIPANQSLIYLFRPNNDYGPDGDKNTKFKIKCNGKEMCVLLNNGYFPFFVGEGKTEISSEFASGFLGIVLTEPTNFVFKAESGKIYYIECEVDESNRQRLIVKSVPEKYGSIRIKECRLLPAQDQP